MHNRKKWSDKSYLEPELAGLFIANFCKAFAQFPTQKASCGDVQKDVSLGERQQGKFVHPLN